MSIHQPLFDFIGVFKLSAVVTGLFLTAVVLGKESKRPSIQRLFAALILCLCGIIMASVFFFSGIYRLTPHLLGILPKLFFAFGPLLYLYTRGLTDAGYSFHPVQLLHFLPLVLFFIWDIPFFLKSGQEKLVLFERLLADPDPEFHLTLVFRFLHLGIYLVLSYLQLQKYHRQLKNHYSSLARRRFRWLANLVIASLAIMAGAVGFYLFWIRGGILTGSIPRYMGLWEPLLLYLIGYGALSRPNFFTGGTLSRSELREKYRHSRLSVAQARQYHDRLIRLMAEKKPYLDCDLTLQQLASLLNISPVYLSQVINQQMNQNFYDFINRQRIEEAKRRFLQPSRKDTEILTVVFDVGFNSKSTFYEAFKKYTGMTPARFKKRQIS